MQDQEAGPGAFYFRCIRRSWIGLGAGIKEPDARGAIVKCLLALKGQIRDSACSGLFLRHLSMDSFSHEPNAIGAPVLLWPQAASTWLFAGGAIAEAFVGRR